MNTNPLSIGQELMNVPMGQMIEQMATAIAEAQIKLDENSIEVAEMMGGLKTVYDDNGNVTFEDSRIFFGRERVSLDAAVQLYNTSNNQELKTKIKDDVLVGTNASHSGDIEPDTNSSGKYKVKDNSDGTQEVTIPQRLSMTELGFSATFYQFVDTIIECRMAISVTQENSSVEEVKSKSRSVNRSASLGWKKGRIEISKNRTVTTTNVNATYSSKYNYSAEGSSLLRTKLTPIPPPPILEERIRRLMDEEFGG